MYRAIRVHAIGVLLLTCFFQTRAGASETNLSGTVVVGIAVSEGLVLVGDSRVTLQNESWDPTYKVVSDSHLKVAGVGNIGLATWGTAFVQGRSINSWVQDFEARLVQESGLEDLPLAAFMRQFRDYLLPKIEQERERVPNASVGFLVAGYSEEGHGQLYRLVLPGKIPADPAVNTQTKPGSSWGGQIDVIGRLIKGVDISELSKLDFFKSLDEPLREDAREQIETIGYKVFYEYLSLQDALDFGHFLVEATVNIQRFTFGTKGEPGRIPGVGGQVHSLLVTPAGLKWIRGRDLHP